MGRLRRLYGKISEVIWEDYGGYIGKLWRLYWKIAEVIWENPLSPWDPIGLPLELLGPLIGIKNQLVDLSRPRLFISNIIFKVWQKAVHGAVWDILAPCGTKQSYAILRLRHGPICYCSLSAV